LRRRQKPQKSEHQAEKRSGQREAAIDRLKDYVERAQQNNDAQTVSQKADHREAQLSLVRDDVLCGRGRIARNKEGIEQNVVAEDYEWRK
jgi:hypothetical protein